MTENTKCNTGCGCAGTKTASDSALAAGTEKFVARKAAEREIDIEFLYLDLEVCDMCRGTETNLDEALADIAALLEKTGVKVNLDKIHVRSFEQALVLDFISSPTIRVAGRDVAFGVRENYCSSCSMLSGTDTYCRVWNFQGEEFSTVPKSLVIEAILKEIYGGGKEKAEVPPGQKAQSLENLKRFFAGTGENAVSANAAPTEPLSFGQPQSRARLKMPPVAPERKN
jgi:hypothetical protein